MVSSPELLQLAAGDGERLEEVDPVHGLAAGRRGEGAAVGGVLVRVSRHQGGLGQPPEPHLGPLLLDLGQSRNQGGQGGIVLGLKASENMDDTIIVEQSLIVIGLMKMI